MSYHSSLNHIDLKKPPPPGGFPSYYVPSPEPCISGPPSKNLVQILRGGSSYTRFLMREHSTQETPPGGGVSFGQHVMRLCVSVERSYIVCLERQSHPMSLKSVKHYVSHMLSLLPAISLKSVTCLMCYDP